MILKRMEVKNFRLLKNFELKFKDELSLVIGKNNCGKTSSLIILDKMLNSSKVMWEDINLEWQKELHEKIINFDISEQEEVSSLEAINLRLFIEYNDNDSYTNIQKFMMDLNPDNNTIVLEFISLISVKKIIELKDILNKKKLKISYHFLNILVRILQTFLKLKNIQEDLMSN